MIPDIEHKVEEIGVFFESTGLTPMEARVFAYLLLADPPEQDFFAIKEFLGASKSTVSNALKHLQSEGRIDYITRPGDRRRYFRVSSQKWLESIQSRLSNMTPFVATLNKVIELRKANSSAAFDEELRSITSYFKYLERELPRVVANWEE